MGVVVFFKDSGELYSFQRLRPEELNTSILNYMTESLGYGLSDVIHTVINNRPSTIMSSYHLLLLTPSHKPTHQEKYYRHTHTQALTHTVSQTIHTYIHTYNTHTHTHTHIHTHTLTHKKTQRHTQQLLL